LLSENRKLAIRLKIKRVDEIMIGRNEGSINFCRYVTSVPSAIPPNIAKAINFGGFRASNVKYGVIAKPTTGPASKIN
jgi:hypothetical protein